MITATALTAKPRHWRANHRNQNCPTTNRNWDLLKPDRNQIWGKPILNPPKPNLPDDESKLGPTYSRATLLAKKSMAALSSPSPQDHAIFCSSAEKHASSWSVGSRRKSTHSAKYPSGFHDRHTKDNRHGYRKYWLNPERHIIMINSQ